MSTSSQNFDLRLVWPQWQGAGSPNFPALIDEVPVAAGRRGYVWGTKVLEAFLPEFHGKTVHVPTPLAPTSDEVTNGIENRPIVLEQLSNAIAALQAEQPKRVLTLGGDCAVSVAPFSYLADQYGSDFAVLWIDSHPDVGTPHSDYPGYHAMAVSALLGKVDADFTEQLPTILKPEQIISVGLHSWTPDDYPNLAAWGIETFDPQASSDPSTIIAALRARGVHNIAIHFDVDTIDAQEIVLGLGAETGGLRSEQVKELLEALQKEFSLVGLTIAEFIPRNLLVLQNIFQNLEIMQGNTHTPAQSE